MCSWYLSVLGSSDGNWSSEAGGMKSFMFGLRSD